MKQKSLHNTGANDRTPSIPQYFSWINNTCEGSTEEQTMINLDFFAWLKRTYGMQLGIYLWDAGNLDCPGGGYAVPDGMKYRTQYPNGYGPCVERAAALGIRMGIWGGPDGFGNTTEEGQKRLEYLVELWRKHRFALLKLDSACSGLRREKAPLLAELLRRCHEYTPDLILLNHRLDLYEAEKYATTFLWQGTETYVDVHIANRETCMHHRGFIFKRGLPDGLARMTEDHGVCISSSVAYFEDDLIYQAFGRSLIMAPEIYANPWLMRDDEFPKLARIYNLHRACAPILVDGMVLNENYGDTPVVRGSKTHRFLTTGHHGWTPRNITLHLNDEIGLSATEGKIAVIQRHPAETLLGIYNYGDTVEAKLMPFRAALFEIAPIDEAYPVLENCVYEVIHEDTEGCPVEVKMLYCDDGEITLLHGGKRTPFGTFEKRDDRDFAPIYLDSLQDEPESPDRFEEWYEATQFAVDNDSLERREARRAGETAIPEVKAARDAFFAQPFYACRGCDSDVVFDDNPDTYFDGQSKTIRDFEGRGIRIENGCLRVDFGDVFKADSVEITCYTRRENQISQSIETTHNGEDPFTEMMARNVEDTSTRAFTRLGSFSDDLKHWRETLDVRITVVDGHCRAPFINGTLGNLDYVEGDRVRLTYPLNGSSIRYFRLPSPMDRIYTIRLLKDGKAVTLKNPKVNNLQAPYGSKAPVATRVAKIKLPATLRDGDYLAVAMNGVHGIEGAYCMAEIDGVPVGFPDRAPAYASNVWEFIVTCTDRNYTYYLPLKASMANKEITVRTLLCNAEYTDLACDVWLCPKH